MDLDTEPQLLTDREGELVVSYTINTDSLNFSVCGKQGRDSGCI
jgi:hypothetical protein